MIDGTCYVNEAIAITLTYSNYCGYLIYMPCVECSWRIYKHIFHIISRVEFTLILDIVIIGNQLILYHIPSMTFTT